MELFPPFEAWLEKAKCGPLPEGLRPMFRIAWNLALTEAIRLCEQEAAERGSSEGGHAASCCAALIRDTLESHAQGVKS